MIIDLIDNQQEKLTEFILLGKLKDEWIDFYYLGSTQAQKF